MKRPFISVATPNFNHGQYIADMIESCLNQDFDDWELTIVDDASTDNSIEVVRPYTAKYNNIRLLRNESNLGSIRSANRALKASSGQHFLLRSADDINLPGFFKTGHELLNTHPRAALFCSDITYFREDLKFGTTESLNLSSKPSFIPPHKLVQLLGITPLHGHSIIIRRELMEKTGYFDPEHGWYNDWLPYMTWAFRRGVCYAPESLVASRLLSDSFCGRNAPKTEVQLKLVGGILRDLIKNHSDLLEACIQSGALGFFGNSLIPAIENSAELRDTLLTRINEISSIVASKRRHDNGIGQVISTSLLRNRERLLQHHLSGGELWIYGGGLHTQILVDQLEIQKLPKPNGILLSELQADLPFELPIQCIESAKIPPNAIIAISSKSYEEAMISQCAKHLPQNEILTFWTSGHQRRSLE